MEVQTYVGEIIYDRSISCCYCIKIEIHMFVDFILINLLFFRSHAAHALRGDYYALEVLKINPSAEAFKSSDNLSQTCSPNCGPETN